jgi:hypothetical protein
VESDRRRLQREAGEAVDETAERRRERERERIRGASASFERGLSAAGGA